MIWRSIPKEYTGYDGSSVWKFFVRKPDLRKEAIEEENDPNGWLASLTGL